MIKACSSAESAFSFYSMGLSSISTGGGRDVWLRVWRSQAEKLMEKRTSDQDFENCTHLNPLATSSLVDIQSGPCSVFSEILLEPLAERHHQKPFLILKVNDGDLKTSCGLIQSLANFWKSLCEQVGQGDESPLHIQQSRQVSLYLKERTKKVLERTLFERRRHERALARKWHLPKWKSDR